MEGLQALSVRAREQRPAAERRFGPQVRGEDRLEAEFLQRGDAGRQPVRVDTARERGDPHAVAGLRHGRTFDGGNTLAGVQGQVPEDLVSRILFVPQPEGFGRRPFIYATYPENVPRREQPGTGTDNPIRSPYLVLLHMGFAIASNRRRPSGALLPHRFTLACPRLPRDPFGPRGSGAGGLLSAALSVASPRLAVSKHAVRWSPDFPPPAVPRRQRPRPVLRHRGG